MARYVIHPGTIVVSGQRKFISATALIKLYGINETECYCLKTEHEKAMFRPRHDDVHLYPKISGDYHLSTVSKS
jgi:hypothetical protein